MPISPSAGAGGFPPRDPKGRGMRFPIAAPRSAGPMKRALLAAGAALAFTAPAIAREKPVDLVDPFVGTLADFGQLSPAAVAPYGMVQLGPDTDPANHAGYDYAARSLRGFRTRVRWAWAVAVAAATCWYRSCRRALERSCRSTRQASVQGPRATG